MFDVTKILEREQLTLIKQRTALQDTLAELEHCEKLAATGKDLGAKIYALRVRRDRQNTVLKTTELYIASLEAGRKAK